MTDTRMGLTYCPNCGSTEIEQHVASGASICTMCGVVVEENVIVSSVEFVEGTDGQSSMMGQYVGANATKPFSKSGSRGNRYGFSRDSRETTLANGRRRIQDVALRLRLGSHFVDAAHRFFTVAVEKNFVQGRRTTHVVAACLYIACRQEKSQHMLIDFSDVLQVNVYTLGTCFLKFRRLLGLRLEIIDPALYVYRFAAHLDLDEKANAVALTALRLVSRMNRDWIVSGRRPAGICAAALLIAARAHGFTRENKDVTKILRVCGVTVMNRVKDFERTPSANLTIEQFKTIDIESEADPPVFTMNRIHEARALAIEQKNMDLLTSGQLDDPRKYGSKRASRWRKVTKLSKKQREQHLLYNMLEMEMTEDKRIEKIHLDSDVNVHKEECIPCRTTIPRMTMQLDGDPKIKLQLFPQNVVPSHIKYPLGNNGRLLVLPNQATPEELRKSTQPEADRLYLEEWMQDMPDKCMDEIDGLFCNDNEVQEKEAIFNKVNKDYIEQQERKESEKMALECLRKENDKLDAAQEEEKMRYLKKKGTRLKNVNGERNDVNFCKVEMTTQDVLLATILTRKISRKINYDALSAIFDETGSFSTDLLEDNEPEKFVNSFQAVR